MGTTAVIPGRHRILRPQGAVGRTQPALAGCVQPRYPSGFFARSPLRFPGCPPVAPSFSPELSTGCVFRLCSARRFTRVSVAVILLFPAVHPDRACCLILLVSSVTWL